jgi:hypothetical protein
VRKPTFSTAEGGQAPSRRCFDGFGLSCICTRHFFPLLTPLSTTSRHGFPHAAVKHRSPRMLGRTELSSTIAQAAFPAADHSTAHRQPLSVVVEGISPGWLDGHAPDLTVLPRLCWSREVVQGWIEHVHTIPYCLSPVLSSPLPVRDASCGGCRGNKCTVLFACQGRNTRIVLSCSGR